MDPCLRCVHCGECAIVDDITLGGCAQKVCAECGVVASDGHFLEAPEVGSVGTTSETEWKFGDQTLTLPMKRALQTKCDAKGKTLGLKKVTELGGVLGLSDSVINESKDLFKKAYCTRQFLNKSLRDKCILAACSVYCVCRQQGWAVSIRHICELKQCNVYDFGPILKLMLKELDLVLPYTSVGSVVASILCKAKLGEAIVEKSSRLLDLCEKGWLSTGRSPLMLVTAVSFVAWQSHDFVARNKITLKTFCGQFNLSYNASSSRRLTEVFNLLIDLGKNIPWLSEGSLNRKNVAFHLHDILKYQKSLLFDLVNKMSKTDSDMEPIADRQYDGQSCEGELLPPACKNRKLGVQVTDSPISREQTEISPDHDLDCEEVSAADIPDHELTKYIRLPEEIEAMRAVKDVG